MRPRARDMEMRPVRQQPRRPEPKPAPQPEPPAPEPIKTKQRKEITLSLPTLSWKLGLVALVVLALAGGAAFFLAHNLQKDPLPENIKQQADFPLYYPTKVPDGFRFDEAAYDPSIKVVSYDYSTVDGNKIFFTLQPRPPHFNFRDFTKKQLSGASTISTPLGAATVGVLDKQTVSSITTDKTWILIGAGEKVNIQQLETISQHLAPVKK